MQNELQYVPQVVYAVNKSDLALYRINFNRFNTLCGDWCGCDSKTWKERAFLKDNNK